MTNFHQQASNIAINIIKPLSVKHNLPLSTVPPEDIYLMVSKGVPFQKIRSYCTDRFEEQETIKKLLDLGYPSELLRKMDQIELNSM